MTVPPELARPVERAGETAAAVKQKYPVLVEDCFAALADILHVVHLALVGGEPDARHWFAARV